MSMNRNLTEEQILCRDTVRKFAEEIVKPKAQDLDDNEEFSYEITAEMANMGFLACFLPTRHVEIHVVDDARSTEVRSAFIPLLVVLKQDATHIRVKLIHGFSSFFQAN